MLVAESLNDYLKEVETDHKTNLFLEGRISKSDWEYYFKQLNESNIGNVLKEKILSVLKSIVSKIKEGSQKVMQILPKIFDALKKFIQKSPRFFKAASLTVLLLLAVSVSSSAQKEEGQDISKGHINLCNAGIGYVKKMSELIQKKAMNRSMEDGIEAMRDEMNPNDSTLSDMETLKLLSKAQTYFIDFRDGKIDDERHKNKETANIVNTIVNSIIDISDEDSAGGEEHLTTLRKIGENIADYSRTASTTTYYTK